MSQPDTLGTRRSIYDLMDDRANGKPEALDALMTAWQGIQALDSNDPNSFFVIGATTASPSGAPVPQTGRPGGAATASTAPCSSPPGTAPTCTDWRRRCRPSRAARA